MCSRESWSSTQFAGAVERNAAGRLQCRRCRVMMGLAFLCVNPLALGGYSTRRVRSAKPHSFGRVSNREGVGGYVQTR